MLRLRRGAPARRMFDPSNYKRYEDREAAAMRIIYLIVILLSSTAWFVTVTPAHAHTGIVDGYGCHVERKTGRYHCHQGPYVGQTFESRNEFLKKLRGGDLQDVAPKDLPPQAKPKN